MAYAMVISKPALLKQLLHLTPIQEKYYDLLESPVDDILDNGAEKANALALSRSVKWRTRWGLVRTVTIRIAAQLIGESADRR